jgi:hypothetical protein
VTVNAPIPKNAAVPKETTRGIAAEEVPRKPQHGEDRDDRQHVLVIRISNDARQYDAKRHRQRR